MTNTTIVQQNDEEDLPTVSILRDDDALVSFEHLMNSPVTDEEKEEEEDVEMILEPEDFRTHTVISNAECSEQQLRQEILLTRSDSLGSIRSFVSDGFLENDDDELLMFEDAASCMIFEDDDDHEDNKVTQESSFLPSSSFIQGQAINNVQLHMHSQHLENKHSLQGSNVTLIDSSSSFEQLWANKMAHLAQSMKKTEATRKHIVRHREMLQLLEEKQDKQRQLELLKERAQQLQRHNQELLLSSTSSPSSGYYTVSKATDSIMSFAQRGRKLQGFMSSLTPSSNHIF